MRSALLPIAAWLGALQALATPPSSADETVRFIGIASVLGSLTVLVYRLGVWRQEMENTRHNVGEQVKAFSAEMTASFARVERRLDRLEAVRTTGGAA